MPERFRVSHPEGGVHGPRMSALDSLPHGPEFRFVDELVSLDPGRSAEGRYRVRGDIGGHLNPDGYAVVVSRMLPSVEQLIARVQD